MPRAAAAVARRGWGLVDPPERPLLFVNPSSGGGKAARTGLVDRARERGIDTVVLGAGLDMAKLVSEAVAGGADVLGVAGGDGSLAVVAAVALAHGLPFVCIPAGTRNHFALDLGVNRHDLVGALDAFADDALERSIDVAEVNGRLFLNNVSLGIYGDAVHKTEYRDAKARTLLEAAREVLGPSPGLSALCLVDDLGREHRRPAVVLVSNNAYALDRPVAPGTRPRLDGGELGIVVLDRPEPGAGPSGRAWTATHFAVEATAAVHAGVDGEAVELNAPLEFLVRPGALRVRISSRHPGVSPSGRLP
jgi:diacylglycerol kinase family enzyme